MLADQQTQGKEFLLLNSDTLFLTDISELRPRHEETQAVLTMALQPMVHFNRYGSVIIRPTNQVIGFEEKKSSDTRIDQRRPVPGQSRLAVFTWLAPCLLFRKRRA